MTYTELRFENFPRRFVDGEPISISPHETLRIDETGEKHYLGTLCGSSHYGNADGGIVCDVNISGNMARAQCSLCDFKETLLVDGSGTVIRPAHRFNTPW